MHVIAHALGDVWALDIQEAFPETFCEVTVGPQSHPFQIRYLDDAKVEQECGTARVLIDNMDSCGRMMHLFYRQGVRVSNTALIFLISS